MAESAFPGGQIARKVRCNLLLKEFFLRIYRLSQVVLQDRSDWVPL